MRNNSRDSHGTNFNIAKNPYVTGVFGAFILLVVWGSVTGMLLFQWRETLNVEMRNNVNVAKALMEHTRRVIDSVDQATLKVQEAALDGRLNGQKLVDIAKETGMTPNILTQLSFVDADGIFQFSNLDPEGLRGAHVNLLDRIHVRVHLLPTQIAPSTMQMVHEGLFIGQTLTGRVSGQQTIQLSRKLVNADGHTAGVIVASINKLHFDEVYRGVQLGAHGGISLTGLDGVIRVRVLGGASSDTDKSTAAPLLQLLTSRSSGAVKLLSNDAVERIVGFSRVGTYPLVVSSGTTVEDAFTTWRTTRNYLLTLTLLLSVAWVAFLVVLFGSIRRLTRSHAALIESEAAAQRANQAKTEFLAAMSHELRTPLTSIRGFAELMEKRSEDAQIQSQSGIIRQAAEYLNALLTEILDLVKVESGAMLIEPEAVVLRDLTHEVTELFRASAKAKALALSASTSPEVPEALVTDRMRVKQILHNLLSNAVKFTLSGSVELNMALGPEGRHVLFSVTDSGPGIPVDEQEVIFKKFNQGNGRVSYQHGGTGLGLSLSRGLAELLGGTLTVESILGKGSTFTLALPLDPAVVLTAARA